MIIIRIEFTGKHLIFNMMLVGTYRFLTMVRYGINILVCPIFSKHSEEERRFGKFHVLYAIGWNVPLTKRVIIRQRVW